LSVQTSVAHHYRATKVLPAQIFGNTRQFAGQSTTRGPIPHFNCSANQVVTFFDPVTLWNHLYLKCRKTKKVPETASNPLNPSCTQGPRYQLKRSWLSHPLPRPEGHAQIPGKLTSHYPNTQEKTSRKSSLVRYSPKPRTMLNITANNSTNTRKVILTVIIS